MLHLRHLTCNRLVNRRGFLVPSLIPSDKAANRSSTACVKPLLLLPPTRRPAAHAPFLSRLASSLRVQQRGPRRLASCAYMRKIVSPSWSACATAAQPLVCGHRILNLAAKNQRRRGCPAQASPRQMTCPSPRWLRRSRSLSASTIRRSTVALPSGRCCIATVNRSSSSSLTLSSRNPVRSLGRMVPVGLGGFFAMFMLFASQRTRCTITCSPRGCSTLLLPKCDDTDSAVTLDRSAYTCVVVSLGVPQHCRGRIQTEGPAYLRRCGVPELVSPPPVLPVPLLNFGLSMVSGQRAQRHTSPSSGCGNAPPTALSMVFSVALGIESSPWRSLSLSRYEPTPSVPTLLRSGYLGRPLRTQPVPPPRFRLGRAEQRPLQVPRPQKLS